jgi:hypothetical protein
MCKKCHAEATHRQRLYWFIRNVVMKVKSDTNDDSDRDDLDDMTRAPRRTGTDE